MAAMYVLFIEREHAATSRKGPGSRVRKGHGGNGAVAEGEGGGWVEQRASAPSR